MNKIKEDSSKDISVLLWNQLAMLFDRTDEEPVIGGWHEYPKSYSHKGERLQFLFDGLDTKLLRTTKWIVNAAGEFVVPENMLRDDLDPCYNLEIPGVSKLIDFLKIQRINPDHVGLSDNNLRKVKLAERISSLVGENATDEQILEWLQRGMEPKIGSSTSNNGGGTTSTTPPPNAPKKFGQRTAEELTQRIEKNGHKPSEKPTVKPEEQPEQDSDEQTPASVDLSKEIEKAKETCEEEICRIEKKQEALTKAEQSEKYSSAWFDSLLELEVIQNGEDNTNSREVSISFGRVEKDENGERTLILKEPSKDIPAVMEELTGINLELDFDDGKEKKLVIDSISIKSYTLRVKLKTADGLDEIPFQMVKEAKIKAQPPMFLLAELQNQFKKLVLPDEYNLRDNLCENIRFIFGPPGTGKTTHLAKDVLIPFMQQDENAKVLILTPTNKAADVLTSRVIECMAGNESYKDWLIRYGVTSDENIEKAGVFYAKNVDLNHFSRCVLATTMARCPYDYLIDENGNRKQLYDVEWDYIIVDEAPMILHRTSVCECIWQTNTEIRNTQRG